MCICCALYHEISIHAPSRERPNSVKPFKCRNGIFQSTLPHGSDIHNSVVMLNKNLISIHAPSRERRIAFSTPTLSIYISIHAPSRERPESAPPNWLEILFQSTLPHGSDADGDSEIMLSENFNPRSLTGATHEPHAAPRRQRYFNPRSLTGATRM